ncbi:Putative pre-16S rRNA nuclease [bacterium HR40]|nr:Putative pre-16S rRNA nuclease [bacterium HR40]
MAATDPGRMLVTPLLTFLRGNEASDMVRVARMARERGAVGLVLGLPLSMDGSEGPPARAMREFAARLAAVVGLPVLLQDERLSTFAVEAAIAEGRIGRRQRRSRHLDHFAAAVILEDALRAIARAHTPR